MRKQEGTKRVDDSWGESRKVFGKRVHEHQHCEMAKGWRGNGMQEYMHGEGEKVDVCAKDGHEGTVGSNINVHFDNGNQDYNGLLSFHQLSHVR